MTAAFERFEAADVRDLIAQFPLAWVCTSGGRDFEASLLPLLGEYDASERLTGLLGHMARRNPLFAALTRDPRAVVLLCGPQAYVSPEHAGRRDWAPTWNYAQLCVEAEIYFEPEETGAAIRRLVQWMERTRERPWQVAELGERYAGLERQVIAFRAKVTKLRARFKLGQDETPATMRSIIDNLPDQAMTQWMLRFNSDRQ